MNYSLLFLALFLSAKSFASAPAATDLPSDYREKVFPVESPLVLEYQFGPEPGNKATLSVVNYPHGKSDLFFFHMHIDEVTSKETGEEVVRRDGGTFMYLGHSSGVRNMIVRVNGTKYEFDPNRIFTDPLADRISPKPNAKDLAELNKFVTWVKRNITAGRTQRARPMVIALHNNTDDDTLGEVLSILTEKKIMGLDNRAVSQNPQWDIDNFYIATMKSTYDTMVNEFIPNISLRMEQPRNIGYLSNWMILTNVEYINVETQRGDTSGNLMMVQWIQNLFY